MNASAARLCGAFEDARCIGCSTAGEISNEGVGDNTLVVTAVDFEHSQVHQSTTQLRSMEDSESVGRRLAGTLPQECLRAVLVFGQGVAINGSAVILGMADVLGKSRPITGGLAEGEPALTVYKKYLGEYAEDLPASGLLFPFAMLQDHHHEVGLIRTILAVNEEEGSLVLAGEIDADGHLKLMHANTDALVTGAESAAQTALAMFRGDAEGLALLVGCVGRKLVMGGRAEEEIEAVAAVFGEKATLAGFDSYGEIGPFVDSTDCKLHNQTMTVTFIGETA